MFKPFNLSKGKPRAIPAPIKIEKKIQANPVSEEIYKTNLEEILKQKEEKREKTKKQTIEKFQKIQQPF